MGRRKQGPELTALACKNLTTPGLHFDGQVPGLALQVGRSGAAKSWVVRYGVPGRRLPRTMGLGSYPGVTLAQARERARAARDLLHAGIDPIEDKRAKRSALAAAVEMPTFERCAEQYVAAHEASWKRSTHGAQLLARLRTYAGPVIGKLRVSDITKAHVVEVLTPIWTTRPAMGKKLRQNIEHVLDYAAASGHRDGPNPATWRGGLKPLLPKRVAAVAVKHHAALPYTEVGAFMQALRTHEGMGARALEFAVLTAARSGEVRGATWGEIDLDAAVWAVPGQRMKSGKEHRVPLAPSAVDLLRKLPRIEGTDLVFPGQRAGRPLSDMSLSAVLRRMEVPAVPHGFRSSFRTWAADQSAHPREVAEAALAHVVGDQVERSYQRGDLFERRRRLMDDWSRYIAAPAAKKSATVTPIRRRSKKDAA
jgi:integrase